MFLCPSRYIRVYGQEGVLRCAHYDSMYCTVLLWSVCACPNLGMYSPLCRAWVRTAQWEKCYLSSFWSFPPPWSLLQRTVCVTELSLIPRAAAAARRHHHRRCLKVVLLTTGSQDLLYYVCIYYLHVLYYIMYVLLDPPWVGPVVGPHSRRPALPSLPSLRYPWEAGTTIDGALR